MVSLTWEDELKGAYVLLSGVPEQSRHIQCPLGDCRVGRGCLWPFRESLQPVSLLFPSLYLPSVKGKTKTKERCNKSVLTTGAKLNGHTSLAINCPRGRGRCLCIWWEEGKVLPKHHLQGCTGWCLKPLPNLRTTLVDKNRG